MSAQTIGVGVVGLGFMGQTHLRAYAALAGSQAVPRVVAVCDRDPKAAKQHAPDGASHTEHFEEILNNPNIDLVSICTPTDTHAELAIAALAAAKHVLIEKPVALDPSTISRIDEAAASAGRLAMPAMCMRFWPGWDTLHAAIRSREFGELRSATFARLGSYPEWSAFYSDIERSGGALFDLHIHDTDFIVWCLGAPDRVATTGSDRHITSLYRWASHPSLHVAAEGSWDNDGSMPFQMRYHADFEHASLEFSLLPEQRLVLHKDGRSDALPLESGDGWTRQIAALVHSIANGTSAPPVSLADALSTTRVLRAEADARASGTWESPILA